MKKQTTTTQPQTSLITLRANGSTLTLQATKKTDSAITSVITRDPEKKATRGMTETHPTMDAAKAHLAKLAEQAVKLGWSRGRVVTPKPDAFTRLPAPPKVAQV